MGFIDGIKLYNVTLKKLLNTIIIRNPKNTPALKGILFLKPYLPAFDIAIILLGPGVKVVINTYDKKAVKLGIKHLKFYFNNTACTLQSQ
jgi:hypothetical protein